LTIKCLNWNSILALNPVSRQKLAVYRSKKRFTADFRFLCFFFIFFEFGMDFEKKPVVNRNRTSAVLVNRLVYTGFVNHDSG
jgi:hypothetical protein